MTKIADIVPILWYSVGMSKVKIDAKYDTALASSNGGRVVVKIGSRLVVGDRGIHRDFLLGLLDQVSQLIKGGFQPLIVLSGAVASGSVAGSQLSVQAQAAIGQMMLSTAVQLSAQTCHLSVAQLLVSRSDIMDRDRYGILEKTLEDLTAHNIIPIINENDALLALNAPNFVDNDQLATVMAIIAKAEHIVILTSIGGVFAENPDRNPDAALIKIIPSISGEVIKQLAHGKNDFGRGGMASKLRAARIATAVGITVHITGYLEHSLVDLLIKKKPSGTVCVAHGNIIRHLYARDRWIISAHNSGAFIQVDEGAKAALIKRKSLLAVGITKHIGQFSKGDSVEVIDNQTNTIALGLASISSDELDRLVENPYNIEVIHANNMRLV